MWNGAEEVSFSAKRATIDGHGSFVRKAQFSSGTAPGVTFRRLLWHSSKKATLAGSSTSVRPAKQGCAQSSTSPAGASTFARPAKLQVPGAIAGYIPSRKWHLCAGPDGDAASSWLPCLDHVQFKAELHHATASLSDSLVTPTGVAASRCIIASGKALNIQSTTPCQPCQRRVSRVDVA